MFCPNCGNKCQDGHLFCGNCGTKLPVEVARAVAPSATPETVSSGTTSTSPHAAPASSSSSLSSATFRNETPMTEGIILTNLPALARKLHTDTDTVSALLHAYAEASLARNIRYRVLDAANYPMLNPEARGRRISLSPTDSWIEHGALLADCYRYGRHTTREETAYLFIIGGEDIIPMPVVRHYMADNPSIGDKDIDTDIPYAYLLGERTHPMLLSGKLFEYEQYFHVGRLPFALDASLDDLTGYLRRAAQAFSGISLTNWYGQTNLPWGDDSQVVVAPLRQARLHTNATLHEESYATMGDYRFSLAQGGLFYSLPITDQDIDRFFDRKANFYYFNLHGSDAPTTGGFVADFKGQGFGAIDPRQLATMEVPNILVTEACYGAKYMQYYRNQSMLLSAIGTQTLLYLGSSRSAFCNNRYPIDNSDRLSNIYIAELLNGNTAGESLYLARKSFFEYDKGRLYDQQLVSIVEFNLFGDPTLRAQRPLQSRIEPASRNIMARKGVQTISERKCIYTADSSAGQQSILDQVRCAVNRNLQQIRETVDRELYARLGVEPRQLRHIFSNHYPDGKSFYSFDYLENHSTFDRLHTAITDVDGKIKTIVSTK
ncbi:MAG: zinc-ribbon domain-containing protein [Rikenellaceae bacterium]|nr:zinc-ribbon domain-containing protein [Rikenellaceae bacterium]